MAQSQKFQIPIITEDDTTEEFPQYFKPGTILKASEKCTTSTSGVENSTSMQSSVLSGSSKQNENITDKTPTVSDETCGKPEESLAAREPTTRFETEFAHLRSSKFYDKSAESASSSENIETKVNEKPKSSGSLLVNPRQRGNPLLKHIRNVPWEFSEIEPDYVVGRTACALFLSLKYHNLFPNYIHDRLKSLGKSYNLRVLLVQVDVVEPSPPLKDLSVIAILAECTLMVAWSAEEAGNYLDTYKMYENKPADFIKEKQDNDNYSQLIDCLTTIRSVNKTDAMVLLSMFKTLKGIVEASVDNLAMCPGVGPLKAKRLYDALRKPLKNEMKSVK